MVKGKRLVMGVAAAVASAACSAWAAEPTAQDLRIQQLETKITQLEAQQASNSKDLAATIDGILRDAERRTQLLATNGDASAGYDNGFFIRAGDWMLKPGAQFQFRDVSNYREEALAHGGDAFDNGFEVRRMKFSLEGTAFTKDLDYLFLWQTNRDTGSLVLEEAWARYFFADDWGVRAGQFKDLVTHEFLMSTKRILACDTSMADAFVGGGVGGWTQGVTLIYGGVRNNNNPLNIEAGFTDGANQLNTDFTGRPQPIADPDPTFSGTPGPHAFDWGLAARVEYKVMGEWKDYSDFTAKGTKQDLLVLGAGTDWSQAANGDQLLATVDAQFENSSGLGLYGAVLYRYLNTELSGKSSDESDWGFLIQASYLINGNWEVFARYDAIMLDNATPVVFDPTETEWIFHEITVGVNYYLGANGSAGHRAKITVDLTYLPGGAPKANTGIGVLDSNHGEPEWILRGQFQLLI